MAADGKISVRVPADLAEWFSGQGKPSDVVVQSLRLMKAGGATSVVGEATDQRIVELSALVDAQRELRLKAEADRDKWRKLAQASMPMADRKPERGSGKIAADVLPVAGDQFPKQLTWWQKQQATKAKGKAG